MDIIRLDTVDSTNRYCELLDLDKVGEFTIVSALEQTAGRGQQGHHWESRRAENLTFSLVLHPNFLAIADQYQLHKVLSLALVDLLDELSVRGTQIKWPNDIYVGDKKICGMLVANKLSGTQLRSSICGIGLNVNQVEFPDWVPNPTSIQLETGCLHDREEVLQSLAEHLSRRYSSLRSGQMKFLDEEYLARLMNLGVERAYDYQGHRIRATIVGVNRYGHLQLTTASGEAISCQMGEISLLPV